MAVYLLWFGLIEKNYVKPAGVPPAASAASAASPAANASRRSTAANQETPLAEPAAALPALPADRKTLESSAWTADFNGSRALIHPRGAALVSYQFRGPLGNVELIADPSPGLFCTWPELEFTHLEGGMGQRFSAARPDGLRILKEFIPESGSLPILRVTLSNPTKKPLDTGPWTLTLGPGLGTVESELSENEEVLRVIGLTPGEGMSQGKIVAFKPTELEEAYRWIAVDNRYFLAAILPKQDQFQKIETFTPSRLVLTAKNIPLEPGGQQVWEVPYYLGAKGHTWLTRYGLGLERSIDFGFFAGLGRFMLNALGRLETWTGNWGWAIILFTVIMQIVLFPLTYKGLKATAAMKKMQPEIEKLKQKYGKDPARLNTEMMELYKRTGSSPLGGCLPMLLQMPVFIALFNTLRNAWELHGAVWVLWIKDLSSKDPYYVLPVVMGGLMIIQNKSNPASSDPVQAKMMTFMPVIFTFMFLNFPSGLVLYWLTNSVLSVIQQFALKDHLENAAS